jgi:hypothetical protein
MHLKQASILLAVLAVVVIAYVVAVRDFQRDAEPEQATFSVGAIAPDRLEVHAQIMSINPTDDQFEVRFGFKPFGKYAANQLGRFAQDLTVVLVTADGYHSVQLPAGEIPGTTEKEIELDEGSPDFYPFDRYTARLGVAAFARSKSGALLPIPTVVNYEEDLGSYSTTARQGPDSTRTSVDVRLAIRRSAAILTFSSMMLAAIVLVSASVLALTILVVLRRFESDFGMMLWSGAMLFALPAVRNALPDSPPLGIQADFFIFMWAETGVALSMVTLTAYLIATRAREGPVRNVVDETPPTG